MRRAICFLVCVTIGLGLAKSVCADEAEDLEKLRKAIYGAISKFDGAASRDVRAYLKSRDLMYKEVAGLTEKLRPKAGTKTYKSESGDFVLVIAANGTSPAEAGENASATDDEAQLVVAIAGDGGPVGGAAGAQAANGIAIALAGRGGFGGGGGGGGGAKGKIGSIGFGGPGGAPSGAASQGGDGGGGGISDVSALRNALKPVKEKSAGDKEKVKEKSAK
jgi:hypothetical protein